MVLTDLFRTALRNVAANKMRALLTMLGVVIGVASVIAMLALGNGARAAVDASFQFLGANQIQIDQRYSMQEGEFKPMGEILSYENGLGLIEASSLITRVDMSVSKDVRARYGRSVIDISAAGSTAQTLDAIVSDSPPPGGNITLKLAIQQDAAQCIVSDTGIGIPDDDLPHLFKRFHRGRNAGGFPGSGLGLAIVRAVMDAHHGSVEAQNLETGCQFIVNLPMTVSK